jgi:methylmalonyl-CoA mutase
MYQRGKIQEESLYYESMKHSGKLPIIGVNTYLSPDGSPTIIPGEVIRATKEEKEYQISMLGELHKTYRKEASESLEELKHKSVTNKNIFSGIMEAAKYSSIGQISNALFEVGGQYRRNM